LTDCHTSGLRRSSARREGYISLLADHLPNYESNSLLRNVRKWTGVNMGSLSRFPSVLSLALHLARESYTVSFNEKLIANASTNIDDNHGGGLLSEMKPLIAKRTCPITIMIGEKVRGY
jgi:hypothetical protein